MYGIHLFFARFNFVFYIPVHYFNLRAGGQGAVYEDKVGGMGVDGAGVKGAGWGRGGGAVVQGAGGETAGNGGKGGRDNINYLVKIITENTENKIFHFLLRNWMFLSASDVCQIPFFTFISLGLTISLFLSLSLSLSLSLI